MARYVFAPGVARGIPQIKEPTLPLWLREGAYVPKGESAYPEAAEAFTAMRNAGAQLLNAAAVLKKDRTRTPERKLLEMSDASEKLLIGNVFPRVDRNRAALKKRIDDIRAKHSKELLAGTMGLDASQAQELRAYLRSLPPEKRDQVIGTAIRDGDQFVVCAALGARSHHLSGLTAVEASTRREDWLRRQFPQDFTEIEAVEHAIKVVDHAAESLMGMWMEMLPDRQKIVEWAKQAQDSEAALTEIRRSGADSHNVNDAYRRQRAANLAALEKERDTLQSLEDERKYRQLEAEVADLKSRQREGEATGGDEGAGDGE